MRFSRRRFRFGLKISTVSLALLSCGCGLEPETLDTLRQAVNEVSQQKSAAVQQNAAGDQSDSESYKPLYPNRENPFSFPPNAPIAEDDDRAIPGVGKIQVLGFAKVDQPRVFLRTQDITHSLQAGEHIDGVEVVSITPPAVQLRKGNLVWTATMFDNAAPQK